jgi:hypothetical protein
MLSRRHGTVVLLATFLAVHVFQSAFAEKIVPTIISGQPADTSAWPDVVNIEIALPNQRTALCSATVVGKKVLLTAAHCGPSGASVKFKYNNANYTGTFTRSSLYPARDHDLAAVVVSSNIVGVSPRTVGGAAVRGTSVDILGYGCTVAGSNSDGILTIGQMVISGFAGFYMVTTSPDGVATCRGDSGGPAVLTEGGKKRLLGINALSNGEDLTYHTRLDVPESQDFLKDVARTQGVEICGINGVQCSDIVDPGDDIPSCTLTATPSSVKLGQVVTLSLVSSKANSATIDGTSATVPTAERKITTAKLGKITAVGQVQGPGGFASCLATYEVNNDGPTPDRPTCTLAAIPKQAKPNQAITIELTAFGSATTASIEGVAVPLPVGRISTSKALVGDYSISGFVRGNGGSSNCFTDFRVTNENIPEPTIPDFSVTPTHCGPNLLVSSGVSTVCMAVIKKPETTEKLNWNQAVHITNADGSVEVLPIIAMRGEGVEKAVTLYANQSVANQNYQVLDTRSALLTTSAANVPVSIEGRSLRQRYFIVESLTAASVSAALAKVRRPQ